MGSVRIRGRTSVKDNLLYKKKEPEIIRISDGNMSILGSAIGSKSHCESWVTNKLNKKLPSLINKLNSLDHAQSSFLLLLFCASFCKMVWYIRTMPPDLLSDSCVHFDEIIIQGFENILGCGLPVFSLSQVCLSTKLCGLRASKTHSAAAYLSSFLLLLLLWKLSFVNLA